jgi:hypothetical protein
MVIFIYFKKITKRSQKITRQKFTKSQEKETLKQKKNWNHKKAYRILWSRAIFVGVFLSSFQNTHIIFRVHAVRLILSMWFHAVAGQWRCQLHENLVFQERQTNACFRLFFQGQSQCDWRGKLYLLSLKSCVATKWNESCYTVQTKLIFVVYICGNLSGLF